MFFCRRAKVAADTEMHILSDDDDVSRSIVVFYRLVPKILIVQACEGEVQRIGRSGHVKRCDRGLEI